MYPTLNAIPAQQSIIENFGGYNHVLRPGDGEWFDMLNLSSDNYPVMSTRHKRRKVTASGEKITGMIDKDGLCYTAGSRLYHNGEWMELSLTDEPKQLISMGAYVIILPDKVWVNTIDHRFGDIENAYSNSSPLTMRLSTIDGDEQEVSIVSDTEPEEPENGTVWLDTSTKPHSLKKYSSSAAIWVSIATTYVRIDAPGIGRDFAQYDGIQMEGLDRCEDEDVKNLGKSAIIWSRGDDFIVIVGILDEVRTVTNQITFARKMPIMDFVVESNNRLWGCRYGIADNGEAVNEIYSCKLGDFKNWSCYMGISTDSYTVSIGSDGPFTGAITHAGYPLFFKENMLHKIYGSVPANFQVQSLPCRGVQNGSAESMAIVNEVLYYLGTNGVCAYDGSIPAEVSSQFGEVKYHAGTAAGMANKYYLRALDSADEASLLILDTAKRMWHRESDFGILRLCGSKGDVYAGQDYAIYSLLGKGDGEEEEDFRWMAQTGIIGGSSMGAKNLSRIGLRLAMAEGSTLRLFAQYDSIGPWLEVCRIRSRSLKAFTLPVKMQRCDHLRLRMEGDGETVLYSIMTTLESGSELGSSDGLVLDF